MGTSSSRPQYDYNFGSPPVGYGQYGNFYPPGAGLYGVARKGSRRAPISPYAMQGFGGYQGGMMPMAAYPGMFPQAIAQPQLIYPTYMQPPQPMLQVSGQPVPGLQGLQMRQQPVVQIPQVQPQFQQQQFQQPGVPGVAPPMTMPEPTIPPGPAPAPQMGMPNAMAPLAGPVPQIDMPEPSIPGPTLMMGTPGPLAGVAGIAPTMNMPEPSVSGIRGDPVMNMPEPAVIGGLDNPSRGLQGAPDGPVIPIMRSPNPDFNPGNPVMPTMPEPMGNPAEPPILPGPMPMPDTATAPIIPDSLANNPLPEPPRDLGVPDHLIRRMPLSHHAGLPHDSGKDLPLPPLRNPLPKLPRDVYNTREYRDLAIGNTLAQANPHGVYPDTWFEQEEDSEGPGFARTLSRLNPFRSNYRDRYGAHRRFNTMPVPMSSGRPTFGPNPDLSSGTDDTDLESDEASPGGLFGAGGLGRSLYRRLPFRSNRQPIRLQAGQGPASGFMPTAGEYPQPMHAFSPPQPQGPPPPPIRFDRNSMEYGGFSHLSPHRILYKKKLYPTAAHLHEAQKFLGRRNDLAEQVRQAESLSELRELIYELSQYVRPDWEQVATEKMEDVLYLKFIQHSDLRNLLLGTGFADLIYAEVADEFWGEGLEGQGANQLGRALMRVRERLRREAAGR